MIFKGFQIYHITLKGRDDERYNDKIFLSTFRRVLVGCTLAGHSVSQHLSLNPTSDRFLCEETCLFASWWRIGFLVILISSIISESWLWCKILLPQSTCILIYFYKLFTTFIYGFFVDLSNFFLCPQGPLPLDTSLLGQRAMRCRAYAKALHYKEEEFHRGPNTETLEALIR